MSSAVMFERTGMAMPGMGVPSMATPTMGTPGMVPSTTHWMVVPRGTVKVEKCSGGIKITCSCEDKMACSMVQNLCAMLPGGMCSLYCAYNGMTCCCCNLTMGMCRYETTDAGVCITCTSGDSKCCEMIQACCDCVCAMMEAGCTCSVLVNQTPICCGTCETSKSKSKPGR